MAVDGTFSHATVQRALPLLQQDAVSSSFFVNGRTTFAVRMSVCLSVCHTRESRLSGCCTTNDNVQSCLML